MPDNWDTLDLDLCDIDAEDVRTCAACGSACPPEWVTCLVCGEPVVDDEPDAAAVTALERCAAEYGGA